LDWLKAIAIVIAIVFVIYLSTPTHALGSLSAVSGSGLVSVSFHFGFYFGCTGRKGRSNRRKCTNISKRLLQML